MVAALPGNIRLKLDQTLGQWRQWRGAEDLVAAPSAVRVLGSGLSNYSVLVEAGRHFVVRIDGIDPALHGLNRQGEWFSLAAAHRAGLAPRPCYFNPELGSLVCEYLEPDAAQPLDLAGLAGLLRNIHRLPARHQRLDLPERILGYEKRVAQHHPVHSATLVPYRRPIRDLLAVAATVEETPVLCHNDLLQANRLYSGGRLLALDWEYSAMGSPWYDLAVVAAGDGLDRRQEAELLQAYAGGPVGRARQQQVAAFCCIYRYLEVLWYLALDRPVLAPEQLEARLGRLADALRQL